jgi:RNA polymerase primary sigma factor
VWWIRQAILQALAEQSRIVRVPLNRAGALHRIGRRASALRQELGREATHAEIAEGMDLSEEEVAKTVAIAQVHLSLDAPLGAGDDTRLLDYLADEESASPDEQTIERALSRRWPSRCRRSRSARARSCGSTSASTATSR